MTWTEQQLQAEHDYRVTERLGILLGDKPATLSANFIAQSEAGEAIERLKESNETRP